MPRDLRPASAVVLDTLACIAEPEAEFLMLFDLRERTTRRLAELAEVLDPQPVPQPVTLPRSSLVQSAPGFLLFRNNPNV